MRSETYVHDMDEILAEKEKYAKEFAEGNENLEKALLCLWGKGLTTTACCAGHPVEETEEYINYNNPAITFYFDDDYEELVRLISSLDKNNIINIDFFVGSELKTVSIQGIKERTNEFFIDMCKDNNIIDENIKKILDLMKSTELTGDTEIPATISIYIKYKDGNIDFVGLSTIDKSIADKIKQHFKCEEYNYCDIKHYSFKMEDLDFINYFN